MTDQNVMNLDALKDKLKAKQDVVGLTFLNTKGAKGTVLPGLSPHGKRQAEMTCTGKGGTCTELHVREQSDWHQVYLCRTCKKPSGKTGGGGHTATQAAPPTSVTLADGTVLSFQALSPDDSLESIAAKETNNAAFQAEVDAQRAALRAKQQAEAQARADQKTREDSGKIQARAKEKKRLLQEQLKRMQSYAQKHNVCVSDVRVKDIEREMAELETQGA